MATENKTWGWQGEAMKMCGVSCMSLGIKCSQAIVHDCIPEALRVFSTRMVQSYCFNN